jgi:ankyrin repeat protein
MIYRHYACEDNQPQICQILLEKGADGDITNKEGKTPKDLSKEALLNALDW